ncbi:calcium-dependent secretion activator-like [Anastrepha obliqua]|uniref:calcium-dependent secretion activator-like n=1 Tax=Anastrepha obliqua TaxID=95512 RepID=UPI00240906F1|nr:calcium-dependent secretion activator-like [Anastrepha obliqua]
MTERIGEELFNELYADSLSDCPSDFEINYSDSEKHNSQSHQKHLYRTANQQYRIHNEVIKSCLYPALADVASDAGGAMNCISGVSYIACNLTMTSAHIRKITTTNTKSNINQFSNRTLAPNSSGISQETLNQSVGSSRANSLPRPISPSPSVVSDKNDGDVHEKHGREEEDRKRRIQLYVFVSRCISYPFNAKQPTDMTKRLPKIAKQQLETIVVRFQAFLKGETQIMADEAFHNAVQSYHDVFLKSDRVQKMVQSGACSQHDFREVFRNNIEKRVR